MLYSWYKAQCDATTTEFPNFFYKVAVIAITEDAHGMANCVLIF
jgi:hypothetical protein